MYVKSVFGKRRIDTIKKTDVNLSPCDDIPRPKTPYFIAFTGLLTSICY